MEAPGDRIERELTANLSVAERTTLIALLKKLLAVEHGAGTAKHEQN